MDIRFNLYYNERNVRVKTEFCAYYIFVKVIFLDKWFTRRKKRIIIYYKDSFKNNFGPRVTAAAGSHKYQLSLIFGNFLQQLELKSFKASTVSCLSA